MGDEAGLRVANVFHAGDGNLHPLVLYSAAAGRDRAGRAAVRARSPSCAWSWAGRCRASTASAPTRRARCRRCSARTTSRSMARVRTAFDPRRAVQPGQGAAHPAAVRRAARQVPAASAGGGGSDRAPVTDQRYDHRRGPDATSTRRVPRRRARHRGPARGSPAPAPPPTGPARSARSTPCSTPPALTGVITHNPGDMTVSVRAGTPLRDAARGAGRRTGSTWRSTPRASPTAPPSAACSPPADAGPAALVLRLAARPGHRRHAGARRRHGGPQRRPRDQERRRLRPGQAAARLLRHARRARRGGAAAAPGPASAVRPLALPCSAAPRPPSTPPGAGRPVRARGAGVDRPTTRTAPAPPRRHRRRPRRPRSDVCRTAAGHRRARWTAPRPRRTRGRGTPRLSAGSRGRRAADRRAALTAARGARRAAGDGRHRRAGHRRRHRHAARPTPSPTAHARVHAAGGTSVLRSRPAGADAPAWGPPPSAIAVLRAVKAELDPHGRFGPGRFDPWM